MGRVSACVAVMAALTLTACGELTSSGGAVADDPTPAPSTAPATAPPNLGWRTTIPAGIPLDSGLPQWGSDYTVSEIGESEGAPDLDWCEPVAVPSAGVADQAGWRATGPEYEAWRVLRLYASDDDARAAARDLGAAATSCSKQRPETFSRRDPVVPLPADEAATLVRTYTDDAGRQSLGATFWLLLRRGNALLLTSSYGEWDPSTNLDDGIARHEKEALAIADSMCVFDADPCTEVVSPNADLKDFPLDLGYPAPTDGDGFPRGRVVDVAFVDHLRYCGALGWDSEGAVRPVELVGTTHNPPSDFAAASFRTLARYADAKVAAAAMATLRAAVEACPEDEQGSNFDKFALAPIDVGEEGFQVTHVSAYDGVVSSVELLDVVRVGDLVLLNALSSDGGPDPEALLTAKLAAEMAGFSGHSVD